MSVLAASAESDPGHRNVEIELSEDPTEGAAHVNSQGPDQGQVNKAVSSTRRTFPISLCTAMCKIPDWKRLTLATGSACGLGASCTGLRAVLMSRENLGNAYPVAASAALLTAAAFAAATYKHTLADQDR
jgi:hypothetical protein